MNDIEHRRGTIRDNAVAALVRSPVFKPHVVKSKKGRTAYRRVEKHRGKSFDRGVFLSVQCPARFFFFCLSL